MEMIEIVVTVCALAQPSQCEEQHLQFAWQGSARQCVMTPQPYLAQWINEHPQMEHRALALRACRAGGRRPMRADQRARRDDFPEQDRHPSGRHGHSERDAGFVLRRRPLPRNRSGRSRTPEAWRRRAARSSTSAANRRARRDAGRPRPRSWPGIGRRGGDAGARARGAAVGRHLPRPTSRRARSTLGAVMVNDVWGLQQDPAMADTVAAAEAAVVIMHNRREKDATLDIVADMRRFFDHSLALAARAGIPDRHIMLDPGIGFGKTARQNIAAIARLGELADYGRPIMVGVSRKAFFGSRDPEGIQARDRGRARRHDRGQPRGGGGRRVAVSRARRRRARRGAERVRHDPQSRSVTGRRD